MLRKTTVLIIPLILLSFALAACGLLSEPAAPSGAIEAIPLEPDSAETGGMATVTAEGSSTAVPLPTTEMTDQAAYPVEAETAGGDGGDGEEAYPAAQPAELLESYPAAEEATAENSGTASGTATVYRIDQAASLVRFELNEELRGVPTLVVGTTDQVAGELSVNLSDLSTIQVGVLQINARTLLTDNNFRNRAIQNQILETNEYEFITFTPTAINGLPASVPLGESVQFSIAGDLTIRDITQPVEFTVEAVSMSETQIVGRASTTINRTHFDLNIPSAPGVANVEEEVDLYIDFTANAV